APIFPQVWNQIEKKLKGLPFVAHGYEFEKRCLNSLFEHYHMGRKRFKIYDTKRASEIVFPDLENHKLQTVAVECGYDFTKQKKHHNALADAEACAMIALEVFVSTY
ncbi:MAG: 3'-5' exoribonuclease, partial [Bacteroidales bacterium]|nr:3'-5' exoribonuclease [Bacteroidales bacterium]